jgi:hypothetical protein
MSYCRFSEGDVYAYACDGGVQFWVTGKTLDRLCNTYDSAYQYAKYLRDEGFDVPSHAIEALRADALEEASHGDGSAVAELVSENAKLREFAKMFAQVADVVACHAAAHIARQCNKKAGDGTHVQRPHTGDDQGLAAEGDDAARQKRPQEQPQVAPLGKEMDECVKHLFCWFWMPGLCHGHLYHLKSCCVKITR